MKARESGDAARKRIFDFIEARQLNGEYPPTIREIGAAVGMASPSTVMFHIKKLEESGELIAMGKEGTSTTRRYTVPKAKRKNADYIPVFSYKCGEQETTIASIRNPDKFPADTYAFRATESYKPYGIIKGDYVLVRPEPIKAGLVAVLSMTPICIPVEDNALEETEAMWKAAGWKILGQVVGVYRKY